MLANIGLRLRDIFASSEPFRNVSIVLLYVKSGRDLQLTCSFSYSVFEQCVRIDTVFRQSGVEESLFRDALLRLSDGRSTLQDQKLFNTRDYTMLTMEEKNNFKHVLRLFPTKFDTSTYNHQHLKDLGYPVAQISSNNNCEATKSAVSNEAKGGMLHKNLSTQCGLVNGSMETVVDVAYLNGEKSPIDMPVVVMLEFKKYTGQQLYEGSNLDINFGDNMSADSVTTHFVLDNHGSQNPRIDT
ncbi:hypothetical protein MKX01_026919 [Papaver californicum]|nr:hypothetical protein MKX01_026919 [Papaver californicum]